MVGVITALAGDAMIIIDAANLPDVHPGVTMVVAENAMGAGGEVLQGEGEELQDAVPQGTTVDLGGVVSVVVPTESIPMRAFEAETVGEEGIGVIGGIGTRRTSRII